MSLLLLVVVVFALMYFLSPDPHFSLDLGKRWCCHALRFTDGIHQAVWCREARTKESRASGSPAC